jgi:GR25 family glycosyltransferase involved in LPS biosynthesis
MSYQFIIITVNEYRYTHMSNMFKLVGNVNVYYLNASTKDNSYNYLNNYTSKTKENYIYCLHSHIRALKYCTESDYDFSIILEDDVTFINDSFIESINELISNWDLYAAYGHKMISIGWIPTFNYLEFQNIESKFKNLNSIPKCKLIDKYYTPGLQGYIVKKSIVMEYIDYLFQPTFDEFYTKIISHSEIISKFKQFNLSLCIERFEIIDNILNILFHQIIIFPPLLIETNITSTLGHNNKENYWDKFFYNFETEKLNYF